MRPARLSPSLLVVVVVLVEGGCGPSSQDSETGGGGDWLEMKMCGDRLPPPPPTSPAGKYYHFKIRGGTARSGPRGSKGSGPIDGKAR